MRDGLRTRSLFLSMLIALSTTATISTAFSQDAQEASRTADSGVNMKLEALESDQPGTNPTFSAFILASRRDRQDPASQLGGVLDLSFAIEASGTTFQTPQGTIRATPSNSPSGWGSVAPVPRQATDEFVQALSFRKFLQSSRPDQLICEALRSHFSLSSADCIGKAATNANQTVSVVLTISDNARHFYEISIAGKSSELALQDTSWTERHVIYVALGFDGTLQPYLTVLNVEPSVSTAGEPASVRGKFETIAVEKNYAILKHFQDRIKTALASTIQTKFTAHAAAR